MFKFIEKIGGRKVFNFILSAGFIILGWFVVGDIEAFRVYVYGIVGLNGLYNTGNIFEHKYEPNKYNGQVENVQ